MNANRCVFCKKKLVGRSDKKFCAVPCKNAWHQKQRKENLSAVEKIDAILHRNRKILSEVMQEHTKKKISRLILDEMGFSFAYFTSTRYNSVGKCYHYVYDFRWMAFSTQEVLILRDRIY